MKRCSWCLETKDDSEFWKAKHTKDRLQGYCKECSKAKVRAHIEKKRAQFKEECAICGDVQVVPGPRLSLDHCHRTGKIRGILCRECNLGNANFKDDPELLRAAAAYLSQ